MRWNQLFAPIAAVATLSAGLVFGQQPGFLESLDGGAAESGEVVEVSSVFVAGEAGKPGRIYVTAKIAPEWHIYSITQADGGPVKSRIKIPASHQYRVGPFVPTAKPESHPEPAFDNLITETHEGTITWVAQFEVAAGVDPAGLSIKGDLKAQACANVCRPPTDYPFTAKVGAAPKIADEPTPPPIPAEANSAPGASTGAGGPPLPGGASVVGGPPVPGAPPFAGGPPMPGAPRVVGGPPIPGLPAGALDLMPTAKPAATGGSVGTYEPPLSHLKWSGRFEPSVVAPGTTGKLLLTADIAPGWHVYAIDTPQGLGNQATLIVIDESNGWAVGLPTADRAPTPAHGTAAVAGSRLLPYFEKQVTWSVDVQVPATALPGNYKIQGTIGFQTCDEGTKCDRPSAVTIEVPVGVAAAPVAAPVPVRFVSAASYPKLAALVKGGPAPETAVVSSTEPAVAVVDYDIGQLRPQAGEQSSSLLVMLGTGLLAGFILNFMPCVLPVIGLKVLSFVEQGGHDPRRVLMLNVWYSLGIISVFWILATIPIVLKLSFGMQFGWGQQFSYDGFNITLVAIVFVMALSFLGVWEIPIPGFAGGGGAQKLANKEGAFGAFVKGVITTVLATPCSGPFLGTAVAFAFRESPPVAYGIFSAMGLGMAAPYLLIGARPELIKLLPKPGEWMDTFKQVMGFVLVATVLWLMMPIHASKVMPTLVLLAGLAAGCWWIGRTPGYAELPEKLKAWTGGAVFAGLIGWFAFGWFGGVSRADFHAAVDNENTHRMRLYKSTDIPVQARVTDPASLEWKSFTMQNFVADVNSGKTVMLEFTAKWCATCKTLKALNLNREQTKQKIERNGVVAYEIDIDEISPEELLFFQKIQPSGSVPVIAIFPADKKYEPIPFGDGYTQTQILEALDRAGPSRKMAAVDRPTNLSSLD
jgi:thiol:disulfide interchange protein